MGPVRIEQATGVANRPLVAQHPGELNLPLESGQMASRGSRWLGYTAMKGRWFVFDDFRAHDDWCRWRAAAWLSGLVALATTVFVAAHLGELEHFLALLRGLDPRWLGLAIALQAGTYIALAALWKLCLRLANADLPLGSLLSLALAKLFTDQVLPTSGLSGTVVLLRGLARRRVPGGVAAATILITLVGYYLAYAIVLALCMAILRVAHQVHAAIVAAGVLFAAVALVLAVAAFRLGAPDRAPLLARARRLPAIARVFDALAEAPPQLLRRPGVVASATLLQLAIFLLDAGTLHSMLRALGEPARASASLAAFVAASVAASVGPTPLGLGSFEAAGVATLHAFGIAIEPALAATLLLRGLTCWLPMLPGLWTVRRESAAATRAPAA